MIEREIVSETSDTITLTRVFSREDFIVYCCCKDFNRTYQFSKVDGPRKLGRLIGIVGHKNCTAVSKRIEGGWYENRYDSGRYNLHQKQKGLKKEAKTSARIRPR
jgi:hypothetical protein